MYHVICIFLCCFPPQAGNDKILEIFNWNINSMAKNTKKSKKHLIFVKLCDIIKKTLIYLRLSVLERKQRSILISL